MYETTRVMETALIIRSDDARGYLQPESILMLQMELAWDGNGDREGEGVWTGTCLELDITVSSPRADLAREELMDLVLLYLNGNDRIGNLDGALRGRRIAEYTMNPPPWEQDESQPRDTFTAATCRLT